MKATCAVCKREYEVSGSAPPGSCVACGGQLKPISQSQPTGTVPPIMAGSTQSSGPQPAPEGPIELAGESAASGMTCPNCGKWIEAGAQICTGCGYSRRLARTLTTRIGTPEMLKPKSRATAEPEVPEIEAERRYRRESARARIGRWDAIRLVVAALLLLALAALVMLAPTGRLEQLLPLKLPPFLQAPRFDLLNASFIMLMFLAIAVPITMLGVRVAAAITNTELNTYFSWLRTAGVLAAVLLVMEIVFTLNQIIFPLPLLLLLIALAGGGGIALLLFTWYLHDVNFSAAIVLSLATTVSAAVGLFAAGAVYGWVGNFIGIGPLIKPLNQWTWPKLSG